MAKREEFTIDEIMQDSMIRLLMKADRVDPIAFEAKLRAIAGTGPASTAPDWEADQDTDADMDEDLVKACTSRGDSCRHTPPGTPIRA